MKYDFKQSIINLDKDWTEENIRVFIDIVILGLLEADKDFSTTTYIKDKTKVTIKFVHAGFASCAPHDGILMFGDRIFKNSFRPGSYGYKGEKPYIVSRCGADKVKSLLWLIIHEYCHLYIDMQKHSHKFYKLIDKKYVNFLWHVIQAN